MKLGADRNKVIVLVALLLVAAVIYLSSGSDSSAPSTAPRVAVTPNSVAEPTAPRRVQQRTNSGEFKPVQGSRRPEDRPDPATVDPELHLDLLARVQSVPPITAGRNLFQYGSAPAPLAPLPSVANIPINRPAPPPIQQQAPPPPVATGPPPPPPINVKYFGYVISKSSGRKVAFLLDGDDSLLVRESDTVKRRYRVVQINLNSIVFEDTESKTRQTLPLSEQPG